ncbi:MAG: hypothetical protein ACRDNK_12250 [Solirubrobacteraceae bacterium]
MSDPTDLLIALRDIGVDPPAVGDAGDGRLRSALQREIGGRRRARRRLRLPFGTRSITLMPAALLVTVATTAAAATVALVNANPTSLFKSNPQGNPNPGQHQTVIPSTVRKLATVDVPDVGPVQAWIASTKQHGTCWGLRGPSGWLTLAMDSRSAGTIPGCAPTRKQQVLAQGNSPVGLAPTSADYLSNSVTDPRGQSWDIYYGSVTADQAAAVRDQSTGKSARLIAGQYFILVERQRANCDGCHDIRAIDAAGRALPPNYGPEQYRNH